ncbi:hypothetical protein [Amycolatopsis sp. WAC 04169]|uniref:hypothetical protein n=1 Tax=Amycolatopsis sp. WAC 04169 TaxID=2203197 RepID=UPI000F7A5D66|nr:hypothetical protein [Amycolatopsis sp. WAC 04169]
MVEDGQGAGVTPPRGSIARLQPEKGPANLWDFVADLLEFVDSAEGGPFTNDDVEAAVARTRLESHGADALLVERLAAQQFHGSEFEIFRAELAAYAYPVLRSWIRRKMIYDLCARMGRPVASTDKIREHLAHSLDDRIELASDAIAEGLRVFRRYALVGGRWSAEGGASLKTYFVGACLRAFPAAYRRWLKEQDSLSGYGLRPETAEGRHLGRRIDSPANVDVAGAVVSEMMVLDRLAAMDPKTRVLAARVVFRTDTHEEAGEPDGLSARAVEGRFYRHRTEWKRREQNRGEV